MTTYTYLDTETTGLDFLVSEIIEIAIIRVGPRGEESRFETKIKPKNIEAAHPRALEVNGYTEEAWADAPQLEEAAEEIAHHLRKSALVGHNVSFDEVLLKENLKRVGMGHLKIPYHKVDTITLVHEHLFPLGLRSASFDRVREFLGWEVRKVHRAMDDAEDARRLHLLLQRAGVWRRCTIRLGRVWRSLRGQMSSPRTT